MTDIEARLKQTELLLEQEKGKNVALTREIAEVKREAKIVKEQAEALAGETANSLAQAATDMKVALGVSQGVWAFAHLGRAFMARKITAARTVHRENQFCILLERMIQHMGKDPAQLQAAVDQAKHVIGVVRRDSEATRIAVHEAAMTNGIDEFEKVYEDLLLAKNDVTKGE